MKRIRFCVTLSLFASALQALHAQERADTVRLEPLVVTAMRLPLPLSSVAATVTVIEGEELRSQGIQYVSDALRQVAGLAVVQSGSFGGLTSIFVRGGESDHVKVLVDGVPVNEPGGAFNFAHLTTDNIERIEIVRGPVSILYGSDAVAGIVQIFTRSGTGTPRIAGGMEIGTVPRDSLGVGRRSGILAFDASVVGGNAVAGYSVAVTRRTTDGTYAFNNEYHNTTASGRVHVTADDRTTANLTVRYTDSEFHFPTDFAGNPVDRNAFDLSEAMTLGLELARRFTERLEGHLLLSSNNSDGGIDDRPDDASDTLGVYASRSQRDVRRRGADARLNYSTGAGTVLTVGVSAEEERERSVSESRSSFGTITGGTDTAVTRRNGAVYAQAVTDMRNLSLNAGLRLDRNQSFGTFFTYRAGVVYRFSSGTRLFASVGNAFKEPTFFENFGGSFVVGNPDLDPERSAMQEVGIEQTVLAGRLVLTGTVFRQRFSDLIDFTFAPTSPGDPNYFNIVGATADGVELELTAAPLGSLIVLGNVAYLRTEVTDSGFAGGVGSAFGQGQRLLRRPAISAGARVSYRVLDRASVTAAVRHVGPRDDLDFSVVDFVTVFEPARVELDPYTVVDLSAQVDVLTPRDGIPGLTLKARIENAWDERYEQILGFPARRRTVIVGARVRF